MTHLEAKIRRDLLRDVLRSVRKTWAGLASGDVMAAADHRNAGTRTLAYVNGLAVHWRVTVGCTCRLERSLIELGMAFDDALAVSLPGPEADVEELIAEVARGVDVLRTRDGIPIDEKTVRERSRNLVSMLVVRYRITLLRQP